eukprot:CAMPEP_0176351200 /NCGR_PEP_ID=MMETSP0126-20121128/10043_1 /TAXON_ID=141414 ORGANISM="Strombidinopsis acuminatum, Strain SPMC142" /NCGR_SAMPLE_ID=MMETSP0126 /ASSEMBLY_ACC=CAM_ASM_000229 /LENGTH=79 /DNA_ID=CAMNT_0017701585 /DNA_START=30 /DNA_END=269 /DNA_ORIENTATION=-
MGNNSTITLRGDDDMNCLKTVLGSDESVVQVLNEMYEDNQELKDIFSSMDKSCPSNLYQAKELLEEMEMEIEDGNETVK